MRCRWKYLAFAFKLILLVVTISITYDSIFDVDHSAVYRPEPDHDLPEEIIRILNRTRSVAPKIVKIGSIPRILLITSWRSGSSFLGDLLQQSDPHTYYFFEPLQYLIDHSRIPDHLLTEARALIGNLMRCHFRAISRYSEHISHHIDYIQRNQFLTSICGTSIEQVKQCNHPRIFYELCHRSHVQVMKFVRLTLRHALQLKLPFQTKIVYLQRDPRAVYNSRKGLPWCTSEACSNISVLCEENEEDLKILRSRTGRRVILVRYEELAMDPWGQSERLFKKLNLEFTPHVKAFIQSHTQNASQAHDPFSTYRNSTAPLSRWKRGLSKDEIIQIQKSCEYVIKTSGYEFV